MPKNVKRNSIKVPLQIMPVASENQGTYEW